MRMLANSQYIYNVVNNEDYQEGIDQQSTAKFLACGGEIIELIRASLSCGSGHYIFRTWAHIRINDNEIGEEEGEHREDPTS